MSNECDKETFSEEIAQLLMTGEHYGYNDISRDLFVTRYITMYGTREAKAENQRWCVHQRGKELLL